MTPSAPASAASAASPMAAAGLPGETPAVTGTRPSAARTTAATTARRSARVRLAASPIVPVATTPWTPASTYARTFASSAAASTSPARPNGVVTAGMIPSKRMVVLRSARVTIATLAARILSGETAREGPLTRFGRAAGLLVGEHTEPLDDPLALDEEGGLRLVPDARAAAEAAGSLRQHERGDDVAPAQLAVDEPAAARQRAVEELDLGAGAELEARAGVRHHRRQREHARGGADTAVAQQVGPAADHTHLLGGRGNRRRGRGHGGRRRRRHGGGVELHARRLDIAPIATAAAGDCGDHHGEGRPQHGARDRHAQHPVMATIPHTRSRPACPPDSSSNPPTTSKRVCGGGRDADGWGRRAPRVGVGGGRHADGCGRRPLPPTRSR